MSQRAMSRRLRYIDYRLGEKRDYPSAQEIAAGLEHRYGESVSSRTIKRDIEYLREQNAPIEYDPTQHGYYYADEAYRHSNELQLQEGDLFAMLVAERAMVAYRNSPYFERVQRIFDKLAEGLPEKVTVKAFEVTSRLSVIPEPVTEIVQEVWDTALLGLRVQKPVALHYQAPGYDEPAIRIVHPYHIVGHNGEWYLLGYSDHHKEVRIYALARVKKARLRTADPRFEIPESFQLGDYIDPGFGVFVNAQAYDIAIRFGRNVAAHIRERQWHPRQSIEEHPDGSVTMRFRSNQLEETLFWTMRWGPEAEILEPPELRSMAAGWLRETLENYKD